MQIGSATARASAVRITARQQGAAALPLLRRSLAGSASHKREVGRMAFREMLRIGDAAIPMVENMFDSEDWAERKAAVCLLRRRGRLTPEQKARAESDPHIAVRHAARTRCRV